MEKILETTRSAYHHGDLRHALVAEALRVLEESGAPAISLRAVAKAVGVSPNAPYRHFEDKDALMAQLCAEGFARLILAFDSTKQSADARESMLSLCAAYVVFARHNPALYRLMFSSYGYSLDSEYCRVTGHQAFGVLVKCVTELQNSGWNTAANAGDLTMMVWAFLHGWVGIVLDSLVPDPAAYPLADRQFGSEAFQRALTALIGAPPLD